MARTQLTVALLAALAYACSERSPVMPSSFAGEGPAIGLATSLRGSSDESARARSAGSPYGGAGIPLIPEPDSVPGNGGGRVNDPQTAEPGFNNFELNVNVHGGPPDTDLFFQFVADVVPGTRGDGACPEFPPPPANTIGVLHTSAGGAAAAHLKFEVPEGAFLAAFDSGVKSDWRWRVVNSTQTFDLRTPCVVLTGK